MNQESEQTASEEESPIEPAPVEAQKDSVSLFIDKLTDIFERDTVVQNVKKTEKGICVVKEFAEKLPAAYQRFLGDLTGGGSSKSEEKCKKRLFGSDTPSAYYLFEGKQSIFGWLIDVDHS